MKVRLLAFDPLQEGDDFRMSSKGIGAGEAAFQLLVGEGGVNGAVADGMDRLGMSAAAAAGDWMMPFHAGADRPATQEAVRCLS